LPNDLSLLRLLGIDLLPPRDDELEALVRKDERRPRRKLPVQPPLTTSRNADQYNRHVRREGGGASRGDADPSEGR
jgi:hypothetical protein